MKVATSLLSRQNLLVGLSILIVALLIAVLGFRQSIGTKEVKVSVLAPDEIVILRTEGGRLQVATLVKNEEFAWQTTYTCPLVDCGALFGKTISKVRVPVHYTYAIPLAKEWKLQFRETHYELKVPNEEPNLPPGLEIAKMQIETKKGWLSPDASANEASLLQQLGPELAAKAHRIDYVAAQRNEARRTVGEFARKWMTEQGVKKTSANYPIKVFFDGEVF